MTVPSAAARPTRNIRRTGSRARGDVPGLLALNVGALWSGFFAQSQAFLWTSFYLFIEYVRPQAIYLQLAVIPWGKIAIVSAMLFSLVEGRIDFRQRLLWALVGLFTLVILASSAVAYAPNLAFEQVRTIWVIWLLAMMIVAGAARSRVEVLLLFVLWCLWNFKMSQSAFRSWLADGFAFRQWGASGSPGWFGNSGELGIEMCMFLPIVGYLLVGLWPSLSKARRIFMAIVALTAVIAAVASSSRGALLGIGAVGVWLLLRSKQRVRASLVIIVLGALTWVMLPAQSKKRFSESGDDQTSTLRLQYWKDGIKIANEHPLLGIGYGNWMSYYTTKYNPNGQLPHNIFIQCVAELGYAGLFVFVLLIIGTFRENALTRRATGHDARAPDRLIFYLASGLDGALVGYLASGFFVTVLFYPFFWINLAMTMALSGYAQGRAMDSRNARRNTRLPRLAGAPAPMPS